MDGCSRMEWMDQYRHLIDQWHIGVVLDAGPELGSMVQDLRRLLVVRGVPIGYGRSPFLREGGKMVMVFV